jgi:hypothetical protein
MGGIAVLCGMEQRVGADQAANMGRQDAMVAAFHFRMIPSSCRDWMPVIPGRATQTSLRSLR